MKKTVILILLVIIPIVAFSQVRPKVGGAKADSISFKDDNWAAWITGISDNIAGTSHKKLTTEYGVKTYVNTVLGTGSVVTDLQVSVDSLADTTAVHNTRINALKAISHTHTNITILNNITSAFTTAQATAISTATSTNTTQGDSIVLHNIRIKAVETAKHSHTNKSTLDLVTSAYKDADSVRLREINDTILVVIRVTDTTLISTEKFSGYILPIGRDIAGFELVQLEAFSPGNGNGTASIKAYRLRGGTEIEVTPVGADINGTATIEGTADDVAVGDYYQFGCKETGTTPYSIAVDVYLKFVRP